ncbi:MAG: trypsin-like peptidase domain-containing protein [Gammaproteobacteria bacterium]|nr:trypsin-like peptidase domain-containing protein [Gammaproteobacteria bacterium]
MKLQGISKLAKILTIFIFSGSILAAQETFSQMHNQPVRIEAYFWNSGPLSGANSQVGYHRMEVQGAVSLRLHFDGIDLGQASYITVTSLADGATQTLDAETMLKDKNKSAIFNGSQVEVRLFAMEEETIQVGIVGVEIGEQDFSSHSQCGSTDDRIASNNPAVGRLNAGCTAWLIDNDKVVTAGHCLGGYDGSEILEFNVPMSSSNGSIRYADPKDQYRVIASSIVSIAAGVGNDWGVFEIRPNSQTGRTAHEAQGRTFRISRNHTAANIRITGHGSDSGSANLTQQTHVGPLVNDSGTRVRYQTDTTGGNSGSPVIDDSTNSAIGVHTHGGCSSIGGSNSGTALKNANFWEATQNFSN